MATVFAGAGMRFDVMLDVIRRVVQAALRDLVFDHGNRISCFLGSDDSSQRVFLQEVKNVLRIVPVHHDVGMCLAFERDKHEFLGKVDGNSTIS